MRTLAAALVFALAATPVLAKGKKAKGPKEGQYCSKKMSGKTAQDASGAMLECKTDPKGKLRWQK